MCGIGSITFDKTVSPSTAALLDGAVSALLASLNSRGGDACGLLCVTANGAVRVQKAPCDAADFNRGRLPVAPHTRAVAVHTRFATQGEPHWNRNNHPVRAGSALVTHNGVVYDDVVRVQGDPEVDTYGLAVAADSCATREPGEDAQTHAERVAAAMADLGGSAACAVAFEGEVSLYVMRLHSSPLYVAEAGGVRITASTIGAVQRVADALDLELPSEPYMRTVAKKAKKGKQAKTYQVADWREVIEYQLEGSVLAWHAGTHSSGRITVPDQYRPITNWQSAGLASGGLWADDGDGDTSWTQDETSAYEVIANRMLNAGTDITSDDDDDSTTDVYRLAGDSICDLCDTPGATTRAYGCACCEGCLRSMGLSESQAPS